MNPLKASNKGYLYNTSTIHPSIHPITGFPNVLCHHLYRSVQSLRFEAALRSLRRKYVTFLLKTGVITVGSFKKTAILYTNTVYLVMQRPDMGCYWYMISIDHVTPCQLVGPCSQPFVNKLPALLCYCQSNHPECSLSAASIPALRETLTLKMSSCWRCWPLERLIKG